MKLLKMFLRNIFIVNLTGPTIPGLITKQILKFIGNILLASYRNFWMQEDGASPPYMSVRSLHLTKRDYFFPNFSKLKVYFSINGLIWVMM